jgi:putative ABC transport system permease protein
MEWLGELWRRLLFLFHRNRFESDLEEEMRFHLEMKGAGASSAARRQFGNATHWREESRDAWGWGPIERAWQDVRFAAHMLRKNAALTTLALLTLGIGIGANTLIFTVVHAVILSPLPYIEPDRLVRILARKPKWGTPMSAPDTADVRAQSTAFADIAVFSPHGLDLTSAGEPEHLQGNMVSTNLFAMLGAMPEIGRVFDAADGKPNANPSVVLSYPLWQRRFGGDRSVIGRTLTMSGQTRTVIGVMPAWFRFPSPAAQYWAPVDQQRMNSPRSIHPFGVVARLKPGVRIEQARTEVKTIAARLEKTYPDTNSGWGADVQSLADYTVGGGVRSALQILLGAVTLVLLVACANVANLALARGVQRRQEMAVRAALGAARGRLARLLFIENLLLALAGGGLGVALAGWGLHALAPLYPPNLPRTSEIRIDSSVLLFTVLASIGTAVLVGLLPAFRLPRADLNTALKAGIQSRGLRTGRTRATLVVAQVALAMVLVTSAGLLIRSFLLRTRVVGFRPDNVLIMKMPSLMGSDTGAVLDRVRMLPGVASAAATTSFSYVQMMRAGVEIAGRLRVESPDGPMFEVISADYFRTIGVPLLKGRAIEEHDNATAPPVAVINRTMAQQYFPNENAIGKQVRLGAKEDWKTIVGVVADVALFSTDEPQRGEIYVPYPQAAPELGPNTLAIRTSVSPKGVAPMVRGVVHQIYPKAPIGKLETMRDDLFDLVAAEWFYTLILGLFGAMALALAALGVYGAVSVAVSLRTHEIGVRMALGAARSDVRGAVLREGLMLWAIGAAIGGAASWTATRLLLSTGLLFQVKPRDPLTFAVVPAVLLAAAIAACWAPARRATRVDPVIALRYE